MTFKELDFEGNLVRLTQHKIGIPIELPMVPDVKDALKRYLQEERSDYDSPYVFLRIVPPYSHISVQAITKIVRTAIAAAGIDPDGRKQGPHAFRSSLASSMVNDNIPYEVVRKTLGHTDQNAIRSYARLDLICEQNVDEMKRIFNKKFPNRLAALDKFLSVALLSP